MTCHIIKHEIVILHGSADVYFLFSEMCLDQAPTIHAMMKQKQCHYDLLNIIKYRFRYDLVTSIVGHTDIIY